MTMKDRFGGLFSVLNRRDLLSIDAIEIGMTDNPPLGTDSYENLMSVWVEEDQNFSSAASNLSLQQIENHLEYVRSYLSGRIVDLTSPDPMRPDASEDLRIDYGSGAGRMRGYVATIDRVLAKVRRGKRKLENEALD